MASCVFENWCKMDEKAMEGIHMKKRQAESHCSYAHWGSDKWVAALASIPSKPKNNIKNWCNWLYERVWTTRSYFLIDYRSQRKEKQMDFGNLQKQMDYL